MKSASRTTKYKNTNFLYSTACVRVNMYKGQVLKKATFRMNDCKYMCNFAKQLLSHFYALALMTYYRYTQCIDTIGFPPPPNDK